MNMQRGDIVVISSIGGINGKPRPLIVIQADILNDNLFTVIVAPLTTETRIESEGFRPIIRPTKNNNLNQISQVVLDRITTIHKKDINQLMGKISKKELSNLNAAISFVCGI